MSFGLTFVVMVAPTVAALSITPLTQAGLALPSQVTVISLIAGAIVSVI